MSTTLWDSAQYLKTDEDRQFYMEACLEEAGDDPDFIIHALKVVARAKNMTELEETTDLSHKGLYDALSSESNPTFSTIVRLAKTLGFTLSLKNNIHYTSMGNTKTLASI